MKTAELRIGNWVMSGNGFYKVECLTSKGIEYVIADEVLWSGDSVIFKHIPLTEEILLKCGFESFDCLCMYLENDIELSFEDGNIYLSAGTYTQTPSELNHIKYLHQFQNLIFALTNEELEINL
tara:strand:+ start:847 stop:1218 length:372 start_codon:yes stop_codon:yes gene_type:complete